MSVTSVTEWKKYLLWGMAAGRCQYEGCNRPLFYDELTKHGFNSAYIAHIIADKPDGPRGHPVLSEQLKDDLSNLMLLCDAHHRLVDKIKVAEHPAERLREMKARHEQRIELLTSIQAERQSQILLYGARVGQHEVPVRYDKAAEAMVPDRFPASRQAIELGLKNTSHTDAEANYWSVEVEHLRRQFGLQVSPRITSSDPGNVINHLSVFALAPIPLLIELGRLLCDIQEADVFQLHREPPGWRWQPSPRGFKYRVVAPAPSSERAKTVAIVLSLSADIVASRVTAVLGDDIAVWLVTHDKPGNDYLQGRSQLKKFRKTMREVFNRVQSVHGEDAELHLFPAVPVSAAVEVGRVWTPKANLPFKVYDQNRSSGGFVYAHTICQ